LETHDSWHFSQEMLSFLLNLLKKKMSLVFAVLVVLTATLQCKIICPETRHKNVEQNHVIIWNAR
jgi:hypothetical protein